MGRELRLTLRNELAELARHGEAVRQFLEENGAPPRVIYVIDLALEEMLSNVVKYAHPQGGVHEIELALQFEPGRLIVTIADDGAPFDPRGFPRYDTSTLLGERSRGQLGIHLVRRLVDEMSYSRQAGRNRVQLAMRL